MAQPTFVQIPIDLIQYARSLNLSGTQYDLWLYLWSKDPFGDRFVNIPSPEEIAAELGANKRTIQRAAQRLSDVDLFDFQGSQWQARNTICSTTTTSGDKKIRIRTKRSTSGQNDPDLDKNVPNVTKRSTSGQNDPNVELEPLPINASSSPQTNKTVQTFHTSQIAEEREIQATTNVIQEEVASTEVLLAEEINQNPSFGQEKLSFGKENNSGARSIVVTESNQEVSGSTIVSQDKLPQPKPSPQPPIPLSPPFKGGSRGMGGWRWLPDGPWNVDGKLDREFQEWLAKKWMAEYNRTDIYKAKADVLLHFKKDPTNLAVWWEVYQSQYIAKARNMKTRLAHGLDISKEEQQEAIANHRAVLPMSEDQQQTTKQPPVIHQPTPQLKSSNQKIEEQQPVLQGEITDPWEQAAAAEAEVAELATAKLATTEASEKVETYITDEEGRRYKDVTGIAARQEKEISAEERKTVAAKLSEFVSALSQKMKIKSDHSSQLGVRSSQLKEERNNYELRTTNYELPNELESLNEMLLDPVFRKDSEILGQVKRYLCNGYLADYDDAGYPISVYAF